MSFLPIVERELRVAARRPATNRARWLAAGIMILTWLSLAGFRQPWLTPPQLGQQLFAVMAFLTMGFSLFAGVFVAADCLSEEQREGTLGLLFLTDLRGADVVLGKLVATSLNTIYSLMAAFPVLALPMLMGGLKPAEFWRAVLVLLATVFLSVSSSLMVSAFCREARSAIFMAAGFMVMLAGALPLLSFMLGFVFTGRAWVTALSWASPVVVFLHAYEAYYGRPAGPAEFWGSWAGLIVLAVLCLVIASTWLPRAWQERQATRLDGGVREWWRRRRFPASTANSLQRDALLSFNPFIWLATRDHLPRVQARLLCVGLLPLWATSYAAVMCAKTLPRYAQVCFLGVFVFHGLFKCLVAMESTRRISEDRQSGALELLLVTPLPEAAMVRGHLQGLRVHFRPFLVVIILLNLALLSIVVAFHDNFGREVSWLAFLVIGGAGVLFLDFRALAWVGLQQGLKAKNHTRALLATIGRVMGLPWLGIFLMFLLGMAGGVGDPWPLFVGWMVFSMINAWGWMSFARSEVRDGIRRRIRGCGPEVVLEERFFTSGLAGRVLKQAE